MMFCQPYGLLVIECFLVTSYRHQSLSQWVNACILCSEDIEERAKVIAKFVELARALQSTCFGNIFSFVAVMTGLASSQVRHHLHFLLLTIFNYCVHCFYRSPV